MNPLLLVLLLECAVAWPGDPDTVPPASCALCWAFGVDPVQDVPDAALPEAQPRCAKGPGGYTLTISRSWLGGYVQFTGTGYCPPADLGAYQICVAEEVEFSRTVSEDRDVTWTVPRTRCRSIGFVDSDGVVRFSQQISSDTTSVCVVLLGSFSAVTRQSPSWSGIGVPVNTWPDRYHELACVRFR